ncbi:MAG: NAD-dependent epimerase/dehydratase family protein, partial [Planctomycetota bacterium]|nr:NAD-dependent epimerase/dehydratase family protein [Planctomycetota bacterium]
MSRDETADAVMGAPMDLQDKTVVVTGGAGFLGRAVLEGLARRGVGRIVVPRQAEYDLVHEEAAERLYRDHDPDLILHLA